MAQAFLCLHFAAVNESKRKMAWVFEQLLFLSKQLVRVKVAKNAEAER